MSESSNVTLLEYIKRNYSLTSDLNDEDIKELVYYIKQNNVCVPFNKFIKYGIYKPSMHASKLINVHKFKIIVDYKWYKLNKTKNYYFHTRAFKYALLKSKNTKRLSMNYIKIEEAVITYDVCKLKEINRKLAYIRTLM